MKKIIILVPVFKRHDIFKKCYDNLKMNQKNNKYFDIKLAFLFSLDDPELNENVEIISRYDLIFYSEKNKPITDKLNSTIKNIVKKYDFDYLMNLGSDNIINPLLFEHYKNMADNDCLFFGLNKSWVYDTLTKQSGVITYNVIAGAGRMIHKSILQQVGNIYTSGMNDSMDTFSQETIQAAGFEANHLIVEDLPALVIDIKSNVNIHTFFEVSRFENYKPLNSLQL